MFCYMIVDKNWGKNMKPAQMKMATILVTMIFILNALVVGIDNKNNVDESHELGIMKNLRHIFDFIKDFLKQFDFLNFLKNDYSIQTKSNSNENNIGVLDDSFLPLEITKSDDFNPNDEDDQWLKHGDIIEYTITVTNPNDDRITDIEIWDTLPEDVAFQSGNWEPFENGTVLNYKNIFDLDGYESKTVYLWVKIADTVEYGNYIQNNASTRSNDIYNVGNTTFERTLIGPPNPIIISKDDGKQENKVNPYPNGFINYSITIENPTEDVILTDIVINDTLPDEVDYINAFNPEDIGFQYNETYHFVKWIIDELPADDPEITVWVNTTVNESVPIDTIIENTAYVESDQTVINESTVETIVIETIPPKTDLIIGQPRYSDGNDWWVNSDTGITLYAYDNIDETGNEMEYYAGVDFIHYEYTWKQTFFEKTIYDGDPDDEDGREDFVKTSFNFNESCIHNFTYYAVDKHDNEETKDNTTFYVDNTPPELDYAPYSSQDFYQIYDEHFYHYNGQWYPGIPDSTTFHLLANGTNNNNDNGCNDGVGFLQTGYEHFWGFTPSQLELQKSVIEPNPDLPVPIYKSGWHEIDFWTEDKLHNRNPGFDESESIDFIVDAEGPEISDTYDGPIYLSNGHLWITNATTKQLHAVDSGGITGGSGVHRIEWRIDKKTDVSEEWEPVTSGIIYDNDLNDTDGILANPTNSIPGGIYAFDHKGEPFIFIDNNGNWSYDPTVDKIVNDDPDNDGFIDDHIADPNKEDEGGLWILDWRNEPYLLKDVDHNWTYDPNQTDDIISIDPDENAPQYNASPKTSELGGLYAFDDSSRPFTFIDYNNNWQYDEDTDKILSLKPRNTGAGEITSAFHIEEDGIHRFVYQAFDKFNTSGIKYKDTVYADNTPPITTITVGFPHDGNCITEDTEITLETEDYLPPSNSGVDYLYYEIDGEPFDTYNKEVTFSFEGEGLHTISWYAVDNLGNIEPKQSQSFCIDHSQPEIEITVGFPNVTGNGEPDFWINSTTDITIKVVNQDCCDLFSANFTINEQTYPLTMDEVEEGYVIPHHLLSEEKRYHLKVEAIDCLDRHVFEERIFYVDTSGPDLSIWSPQDGGFYSDGSTVSCLVYAEDNPCQNPPCTAVGISQGKSACAELIDIFPDFKRQPLTNVDCVYDPDNNGSTFFRGTFQIPNPSNLTDDGFVILIVGAEDDLGNWQNTIIDTLYDYYLNSYGDEDLFQSLINKNNQLLDDIVWLNIDNTKPTVDILTPCCEGDQIGPGTFQIKVAANDSFSGINTAAECFITLDNTTVGTISYDDDKDCYEGIIGIPPGISGNVFLSASVFDNAGNKGTTKMLVDCINDQSIPTAQIVQPENDDIISADNVTILINASDDETASEYLSVDLHISIQDYHDFVYEATYDTQKKLFTVELNLTAIKNNSDIYIQAFVTDIEGNMGASSFNKFTVQTNVYFAKWMNKGWNLIDFGYIQGDMNISTVFSPIIDSYKIIFELESGLYNISNQNFNTLTMITPGEKYWVKMKEASGFYLEN